MKIAIVTAYFTPINTPRSFRATELAREFYRQGHDVTVYNAITVQSFDYKLFQESEGFQIINVNALTYNKSYHANSTGKKSSTNLYLIDLKKLLKNSLYYLTTNSWLKLYLRLKSGLKILDNYDLLISIGLPFHVHWAVGNTVSRNKNVVACAVADYGDPFSTNKASPVAFYFKRIERKILRSFDFITVPIEEAVPAFVSLKDCSRIKVIPQGYDLNKTKIATYIPNQVITFAYAGLFYSKLRNPKLLFECLCKMKQDFRFILFTDIHSDDNYSCFVPYIKSLGKKLIILDLISRDKVIFELSKADFLININNISKNQSPSKLIDYALTKRPVFSMTQHSFDEHKFNCFLKRDYSGSDSIDLFKYDIRNIACKFLALANEK